MQLLRKVEVVARKVGNRAEVRAVAERLGVKQGRYEAVEKEEDCGGGDGVFTIDRDGDELNMCVSLPSLATRPIDMLVAHAPVVHVPTGRSSRSCTTSWCGLLTTRSTRLRHR